MKTIGAGKDDYFETMVFRCDGETPYGDPNLTSDELMCERYATSIMAERGHRQICEMYARK